MCICVHTHVEARGHLRHPWNGWPVSTRGLCAFVFLATEWQLCSTMYSFLFGLLGLNSFSYGYASNTLLTEPSLQAQVSY